MKDTRRTASIQGFRNSGRVHCMLMIPLTIPQFFGQRTGMFQGDLNSAWRFYSEKSDAALTEKDSPERGYAVNFRKVDSKLYSSTPYQDAGACKTACLRAE